MIKPMTDEEAKRAIERAKANRFDEAGNYGENNGPLPKMTEREERDATWAAYEEAKTKIEEAKAAAWAAYREVEAAAWAAYIEAITKIEEEYKDD